MLFRSMERLLQAMHDSKVDFTNFFRSLGKLKIDESISQNPLRDQFIDRDSIDHWFGDYVERLKVESYPDEVRQHAMNQVNPKYILRNHLAQIAIEKAQDKDFSEVTKLLKILSNPFDEQSEYETYSMAPPPNTRVVEVSCSS